MADITNVNLLFLRKARGIMPLSRYAMQDDGTLIVAVPDEMEVRTFHLARFNEKGRSQVLDTYNVETLRRVEIGEGGKHHIGFTDDDLYIFQGARKSRFLSDRRAHYTDLSFAATGQKFAVALSDLLASGHTLALGDPTGRLLWTKDISFPILRVAMDRDGSHILVAGETGDLLMLDAARNTLLNHRQQVPMEAVALTGRDRAFFAGGGGVGAVDAEGKLLWFTEVTGEIREVATDAAGKTVAVLAQFEDTGGGRLLFLSADGLPTWDIDFEETRPTGLSIAANGQYAAVTLRDGTLGVYELQYGDRIASAGSDQVLAEARAARAGEGSLRGAVDLLKNRLAAVPSDVPACEMLAEVLNDLRDRTLAAAQTAEAVGDFAGADHRLAEALEVAPLDDQLQGTRRALRHRWNQEARAAGQAALAAGDGQTAEAKLLEAIEADPLDALARTLLGDARHAAATEALERAKAHLAAGAFGEAIAALAEAQGRGASGPEPADLLRRARVGEALTLGNALYQDRQYAAALFQFKKVLRLDPDNVEAQQKISYAQNFLQDTQLNERFTRLE
jgi:Tetratricopeptide repeat.